MHHPVTLDEARESLPALLPAGGASDYALFLLDASGRVASWNPGSALATGYVAAEIVGRELALFYPLEARERGQPGAQLAHAARHGRAEDEGWRVRRDDSRFWASVELTALRDDRGGVTGFACITRDLTTRKATEDALHARSEHLSAVVAAQQEITAAGLTLSALLPRIVERGRQLTGADAAIIELCVPRDGASEMTRAHHGLPELDIALASIISPNWPGSGATPVACLRYDDNDEPGEVIGDACDRAGVGALLAIPIVHDGALLGALAVLAHSPLAFDEQDAGTVQMMAGLLSGPLSHAQAYEAKRFLVAERTLALAAYRESEARFRAAMDASLDALFILSAVRDDADTIVDFELLDTNRCGEEIIGLSRDFLVSQRLGQLGQRALELLRVPDLADVVRTRTALERERETSDGTGRTRWLQEQIAPLDDGVTVTVRDVTSRKEVEAEASRARLAAEAANRAKTDFVARMSHELRTPLNSVIGFANILLKNKRGALDVSEVEYVHRIQGAGTHLLGLINDVLDIAKVEAGRMTLELTMVDVGALGRGILAQLDAQAAASGVVLRLEAPAGGAMLLTDVGKLQQVLLNLVGNALKFTRSGSVTVHIRVDDERGIVGDAARASRIEVHDTGIGIPADRLGAIFEAFEQADSSTSRHYGGTGLGLSISRSLCEALGYRLDVESQVGRGSCFTISVGNEMDIDVVEPVHAWIAITEQSSAI